MRERDGQACTECGMTNEEHLAVYGKALDVHRTTPGSVYTVEGCVTVCRACHGPLPKSPRGSNPNPVLYLRLSADHEAAIQAVIKAQRIPPDRTAVGLTALEEFLQRVGHWPPKAR